VKPPKDHRRARRKTSIVLCVLVGAFFLYGGLMTIGSAVGTGLFFTALGVLFIAAAVVLIRDDRRRAT
jgi:hypothetical protein